MSSWEKLRFSMNWLTSDLKKEIRKVFEPKYKRRLSDGEVLEIATNLTEVVENILRFKWSQKYGAIDTRP